MDTSPDGLRDRDRGGPRFFHRKSGHQRCRRPPQPGPDNDRPGTHSAPRTALAQEDVVVRGAHLDCAASSQMRPRSRGPRAAWANSAGAAPGPELPERSQGGVNDCRTGSTRLNELGGPTRRSLARALDLAARPARRKWGMATSRQRSEACWLWRRRCSSIIVCIPTCRAIGRRTSTESGRRRARRDATRQAYREAWRAILAVDYRPVLRDGARGAGGAGGVNLDIDTGRSQSGGCRGGRGRGSFGPASRSPRAHRNRVSIRLGTTAPLHIHRCRRTSGVPRHP